MLAAVVRSWKNDKVMEQIKFLLSSERINYVVVAINADIQNKGEEKGAYTKDLLQAAFSQELNSRLIVHSVSNWGKNPGSAAALNEAVSELFYRLGRTPGGEDFIFNLSVESRINHQMIDRAVELFARNKDLAVVGAKRKILIGESEEEQNLLKRVENNLQYQVPQNTAAFWRADLLRLAGGFRTECDFSDMTIEIDGQMVPVAGMEDFPPTCFLVLCGYKWALIKDNPMIWDLRGLKQDEAKWEQNVKKMKRQDMVMEIWAKKYFGISLDQLMSKLKSAELYQP